MLYKTLTPFFLVRNHSEVRWIHPISSVDSDPFLPRGPESFSLANVFTAVPAQCKGRWKSRMEGMYNKARRMGGMRIISWNWINYCALLYFRATNIRTYVLFNSNDKKTFILQMCVLRIRTATLLSRVLLYTCGVPGVARVVLIIFFSISLYLLPLSTGLNQIYTVIIVLSFWTSNIQNIINSYQNSAVWLRKGRLGWFYRHFVNITFRFFFSARV